jgi:hypothetical protein
VITVELAPQLFCTKCHETVGADECRGEDGDMEHAFDADCVGDPPQYKAMYHGPVVRLG